MSKYISKNGQWVTPEETSGSIQNTSSNVSIEVTVNAMENQGLILAPMQIVNFEGTIYVKSTSSKEAQFRVVPFKISAGGGGGGGGTPYILPTASKTVKGGIKVGTGLAINNQVLEALPNYTNNVNYVVGDKVVYNNAIYYCKTAHNSTSTFNPTNWQLLGSSGTSIDFWASGTQYNVNDLVIKDDKIYYCKVANQDTSWTESKWQLLGKVCITDWASNTQYVAKDLVIYDKKIYQAKSNHTSGTTFNENNWDLISGCEDQLVDWESNTQYKVKDFVVYDKKIYRCKTAHTSGTTFVDTNWDLISGCEDQITDWAANTQYAVKDIVINDNTIYRCKTAHTSGTTFSDTNWDKLSGDGGNSITKWAANTSYKVGNIVISNGSLFYCLTAHTSSTFSSDSANWELIYSDMKLWNPSTYYTVSVTVINNKKVYRCKTAHTSGTTFNSTEEANWELISGGGATIEDWASSTGYVVGDIVISNNNLYKCKTAHTSGNTFDSTEEANWDLISSGSDEHILLDWKQSTKYEVNEIVYYNGSIFRCKTAHTSGTTGLASDIANWALITSDIKVWNPSTSYIAGVVVIQGNKLYKCKTTHVSATSFNTTEKANWDEIVGGSGVSIEDWAAGGTYAVGDFAIYNDFIYKCTTANSDSNFTPSNWRKLGGIPNWQASKSYLVGDVVINDKKLYQCKTAHTSGTTFSDTNWNLISSGSGTSIDDWATSTQYKVGDLVIRENNLYRCKTAHTSSAFNTDIANWIKLDNIPDWKQNTYYAVGDYLYYDKNIYKVVTAFTSSTTFSATNLEMLGGTPLTTAEETAIINNFSPQMTAFNNVSNLYTTEERAIGIWIDGKTLYQKTVEVTLPSSSSSQSYSYMPSIPWGNIDTLVDVDGFVNRSDGWYVKYGVTFVSSSGSYLKLYIDWNKSTSQIYFFVDANNPGTAGQKATLTFKYTKI